MPLKFIIRLTRITSLFFIIFLFFQAPVSAQFKSCKKFDTYPAVEKVRFDFKRMLHRPAVDPRPHLTSYKTDSVIIERGYIYSEKTEKVPILIYKPVASAARSFPVVICLHGTGGSKDDNSIQELLYQATLAGMMGVAIDARYHGERVAGGANKSQEYVQAIADVLADKGGTNREHPFFYDTVYDLWRLTDYLVTRPDVQPKRIGMMGISMGGIETWMAASVDTRIKVAVPVIAAQSFNWSLNHNRWQGRAQTIWKAHLQAANDRGDSTVNRENVAQVWSTLIPGITNKFDCPSMIRLFAPRPLLLLNNEKDANCPLEGAEIVFAEARKVYQLKNAPGKLGIHVTPNEPHRFLPAHVGMTIAWFKKWL